MISSRRTPLRGILCWGEGEDLGGAGRPLSEGSPYPPNLPDPPRTSPKSTRLCRVKICFALFGAGALGGSFLLVWAVGSFCSVRLSRSFGVRDTVREYFSALVYGIVQPLISNISPKRNDPRVVSPQSSTNSCHFYPVAERVKTSAFRWRNAARSSRNW